MDSPFHITLYDKNLVRTGFLNDPVELTVNPKHNAVGSAVITVASNHRRLGLLRDARVVIEYQGEHLMSGYTTSGTLTLPRTQGTATVTVQDDLWLMWRMLGWPQPGHADPYGNQGTKDDPRTGPAETVVKEYVTANMFHNAVDPIIVATDLARGADITVASRMKVLADVLMDAVDKAGIGLSARQVGTDIVLDAYEPDVYPHLLSEDAGTVLTGEFSWAAPTATRTIIGGPDAGTSREFRLVTDATLEADLGYTIEVFTDGQSSTGSSEMDEAGVAALAAATAKSGISLGLSDSAVFKYGPGGVHVGDQVSVEVGGAVFTDVLREATLSFTADAGLVVTPAVGQRTDDPDRTTYAFLAALTKGIRDLRTR